MEKHLPIPFLLICLFQIAKERENAIFTNRTQPQKAAFLQK